MVTIINSFEVGNYDEWRNLFDNDASTRENAKVEIVNIYRDVTNPNSLTVIANMPDADSARAFASSPKMKENMEKAGITNMNVKVVEQM